MGWLYEQKFYKKHRELMLCLLDIAIVTLSFFLSITLKFNFDIGMLLSLDMKRSLMMLCSVINIYVGCFLVFRIHKSLWKYVGAQEVVHLCTSVCIATCLLSLCHFCIYGDNKAMTSTLIMTAILSVFMMLVVRLSYRLLRRNNIGEKNRLRTLIVGAGDAGYILVKELNQNKNLHVIGFIDDYKVGRTVDGHRVVGRISQLPELIASLQIGMVYVAIPSASKALSHQILDLCVPLKIKVKIMKTVEERFYGDTAKSYPVSDVSIEDLLGRGEIHLEQDEIASYIGGQCILVTGAGGSIGSELCRQIVRFHPKRLLMVDINENGLYMLEQEFNRKRIHEKIDENIEIVSYVASVRDYTSLQDIFKREQPDAVYHAAAHKHVPLMETRPIEAIKNNVFGTNNVIKACIHHNVGRFIMISTDKAVNPTNVMGATKRMTEMLLQANGNNGVTKMAAVRFGNVLGSNGSVIPIFKEQIAEGGPLTITDKRIERYFMTIPEATQLVLQAGYYAETGEIFVLDMGKPIKILDLAEKLIRLSGYEPYSDIEIKEIGLRPGEKMYEELSLANEIRYKTKNDLIYVNERMEITLDEMRSKLCDLQKLVVDEVNPIILKQTLMELIELDAVKEQVNV